MISQTITSGLNIFENCRKTYELLITWVSVEAIRIHSMITIYNRSSIHNIVIIAHVAVHRHFEVCNTKTSCIIIMLAELLALKLGIDVVVKGTISAIFPTRFQSPQFWLKTRNRCQNCYSYGNLNLFHMIILQE